MTTEKHRERASEIAHAYLPYSQARYNIERAMATEFAAVEAETRKRAAGEIRSLGEVLDNRVDRESAMDLADRIEKGAE